MCAKGEDGRVKVWYNMCVKLAMAVCAMALAGSAAAKPLAMGPLGPADEWSREAFTNAVSFRVIEPIRKLVTTTRASDGCLVNPSRLVYGTNAWLEVDQNGTLPSSEIVWRVVTGPGEIIVTNRYRACVRATETNGTVVVEASFGGENAIQPRFVLPIIRKRCVGVKTCIVADDLGSMSISEEHVDSKFCQANAIFAQVGIEFYNSSIVVLTNSAFLVIAEHPIITNKNGVVVLSNQPTVQVTNLLAQTALDAGEEIKLFFVDRIINGTPIAFTMRSENSCVFSNYRNATASVMAHELGHVLGLDDIYADRSNGREFLPQGDLPLWSGIFLDYVNDRVGGDGRGFYESSDTYRDALFLLLMSGRDYGGSDIPSGMVKGFSMSSRHIFDIQDVTVGASAIKETLR